MLSSALRRLSIGKSAFFQESISNVLDFPKSTLLRLNLYRILGLGLAPATVLVDPRRLPETVNLSLNLSRTSVGDITQSEVSPSHETTLRLGYASHIVQGP